MVGTAAIFRFWAEAQYIRAKLRLDVAEMLRAGRDPSGKVRCGSLRFAIVWHYWPKKDGSSAEYLAALKNDIIGWASELAAALRPLALWVLLLLAQFTRATREAVEAATEQRLLCPPPEPLVITPKIQPNAPSA